jgi:hypothetical protein
MCKRLSQRSSSHPRHRQNEERNFEISLPILYFALFISCFYPKVNLSNDAPSIDPPIASLEEHHAHDVI